MERRVQGQGGKRRPGQGEVGQGRRDDLRPGCRGGQAELHDQVGARQESLVNRGREVGRGHHYRARPGGREVVKPREHCVRGPLHVHRVGLEGGEASPHGEALHLVDHDHDVRPCPGQGRDHVAEQPDDIPLAFPEHLTRQGVRVDLDERRRAARRHGERRGLGQPAGKRGLPGAWRPGQHDEPARYRRRGQRRQAPGMQHRDQRRPEQALPGASRHHQGMPRPVVVIGRQHVHAADAAGEVLGRPRPGPGEPGPGRIRRAHGQVGRAKGGQSTVDGSPACRSRMWSGGSSNSTSGSHRARIVSRRLSNMWILTTRAVRAGSSLMC